MSTHSEQIPENKNQSVVNGSSQLHAGSESALEFVDNTPKGVAQRKLQEQVTNSLQVSKLSTFQEMANISPMADQVAQFQVIANNYSSLQEHPVKKEESKTGVSNNLKFVSLNTPVFVPARGKTTRPAVQQNKGVIQAKMFFSPNKHYLADPNDLTIHSVNQYQQWFSNRVNALADNADAEAARGAVNAEFAARGLNVIYRLRWAGNTVTLETIGGRRLEDLGTVMHDQNPNLYVTHAVAGGGNIHVNRSDRSQKVQDSSGQYMERFVKRSLAAPDLANVQGQNDLRGPNIGNRTTLDHVTGINDGDFLSFSTDANDVMNAHGQMFNAAGRGRVEVDLAHMAAANINNLSTRAGVRANLRPQMGQYARDNFNQIMTDGEARANAERAAGPAPALIPGDVGAHRRTAGQNNPHHGNLPDIQYQAVSDAFRTKEVLLEGAVPFHAVTDYNANAGAHAIGAPAANAIAGNLAASQALTQAADQTLTAAEQIPAVAVAAGYQNELPRVNRRLSALMNISFKENKARAGANTGTRNKQYKKALKTEKFRMMNEAAQLATLYHRRSAAGWADATPVNFRTRLQMLLNGAPNSYSAIQPPP